MNPAPRSCQASLGAFCLGLGLLSPPEARGAEFGIGAYLLGLTVPLGGITPAPGTYFKDTFLLYDGGTARTSTSRVAYDFVVNIATFAWFPEFTIFGAAPGVAATIPYVGDRTTITRSLTDSTGAARRSETVKSVHGLGDSEFTALLGWHAGDHHWNVSVTAYTPTGSKDPEGIAATGLNRPALDFRGAYTFLSSVTGIELTGIAGVTVNAMNNFTNYRTGAEFHFEWALNQHFPFGLYAGVTGYVYQQLTGDSGPGAVNGSFIGEAIAVGPMVGYTIKAGDQKLYLAARWYHEVRSRNRPRGDAIFASLAFPL